MITVPSDPSAFLIYFIREAKAFASARTFLSEKADIISGMLPSEFAASSNSLLNPRFTHDGA